MFKLNSIVSIFLLTISVSSTSVAFASGNHSQGNHKDPICDDLKGGTKNLYGLCNAYCSAKDIVVDEDFKIKKAYKLKNMSYKIKRRIKRSIRKRIRKGMSDEMNLARTQAKILRIYDRKKKESDPSMPCNDQQVVTCPGWSAAELADIGTHGFTINEVEDVENQVYSDSESSLFNGSIKALIYADNGTYFASYFHSTTTDSSNNTIGNREVEISEQEFEACKNQLLDH